MLVTFFVFDELYPYCLLLFLFFFFLSQRRISFQVKKTVKRKTDKWILNYGLQNGSKKSCGGAI